MLITMMLITMMIYDYAAMHNIPVSGMIITGICG